MVLEFNEETCHMFDLMISFLLFGNVYSFDTHRHILMRRSCIKSHAPHSATSLQLHPDGLREMESSSNRRPFGPPVTTVKIMATLCQPGFWQAIPQDSSNEPCNKKTQILAITNISGDFDGF